MPDTSLQQRPVRVLRFDEWRSKSEGARQDVRKEVVACHMVQDFIHAAHVAQEASGSGAQDNAEAKHGTRRCSFALGFGHGFGFIGVRFHIAMENVAIHSYTLSDV